ncbi:MAG TPA: isopentenyl transferase family protein, partial [Myxococcota bacterium]|nr:isopentenyl transferase family protein [Myxococcota bacterium]
MGAPVDTLYTPPLWAVVGQTASGKSAVALALARAVGGEIISCDSVQIYRGFDIGAAKPSAAERAAVPHHLIDVAAPGEPFDAARYVSLATEAVADVRRRGRVPILCGGTGLYLRALRYGLIADVESDPA